MMVWMIGGVVALALLGWRIIYAAEQHDKPKAKQRSSNRKNP